MPIDDIDAAGEAKVFCVAERHDTPCPQPCAACIDECEPTDQLPADRVVIDDYETGDWHTV